MTGVLFMIAPAQQVMNQKLRTRSIRSRKLLKTNIIRRAERWLQQQGVVPLSLQRMSGHTNHVFLIEQQGGVKTVLRMANHALAAGLCPLADQGGRIIALHNDAAELGLAPEVLGADAQDGVMWLRYAGQPCALQDQDYGVIRGLLECLHSSQLDWFDDSEQNSDGAMLGYLEQLLKLPAESKHLYRPVQDYAAVLYEQGVQRGYADYPVVPVHSDLNPGNCLYDKTTGCWALIDWDFAGMRVAVWDYAGLVVEHGWELERGRAFAPESIATEDLVWFCAVFALLSWDWHLQRGSVEKLLREKQDVFLYWLSCYAEPAEKFW